MPPLDAPGQPLRGAGGSPWRWRRAFPFLDRIDPVLLDEREIPLEPLALPGLPRGVLALRDDLLPTGSWKDRGSAILVAALAAAGRRALVEDSSGNAGLSLARYARAAGLSLRVFVPRGASALKKELIRAAGAELVEVEGPRDRAAAAVRAAVGPGVTYASHAAQSLFTAAAATAAFDLVAALGRIPDAIVGAAGQGGYLVGIDAGMRALTGATEGPRPRILAIQPASCAPIARAFERGTPDVLPWDRPSTSIAEGAAVPAPVRAGELLEATRASRGAVLTVDEPAIRHALERLWSAGVRVEPTAALPVAFLLDRRAEQWCEPEAAVVVLLSGHGIRQGRAILDPGAEGRA